MGVVRLGYALSSEEHRPARLVELAQRADAVGFEYAFISDHFHPWTTHQGQSAFVWGVLGAIAASTERITLITGVTCPTMRIHPAVLAQATATAASLMPGRFGFGVGTGENLNEHVTGRHWPPIETRREMLEEAVAIIREMWKGEVFTHQGKHFTVEDARVFSLPDTPPPVVVAASGTTSAKLAGRIGDALVSTAPKREVIDAFRAAGGTGKPAYGQVTVCCAASEAQARATALEWWPNAAIPGQLGQELRLPTYFDQAAQLVTEDAIAKTIVCSSDPQRHIDAINEFATLGFDHVYIHQVGPDQEPFFTLYEREVLPHFSGQLVGAGAGAG